MRPRPRPGVRAALLCVLCAASTVALGCTPPPRPAPPPPPPQPVRTIERDAPFIVDWEPKQVERLAAAVRSPNIGAVVVAYREDVIRLLPDCWISGVYAGTGVGTYTGTLQLRGAGSTRPAAELLPGAFQQVSTSGAIAEGALLAYRFVVVGRYDVSGSRRSAGLLELQERTPAACRDATHFVRAASTGAFERMTDPTEGMAPQAGAPRAGVPGKTQATLPVQGGDFGRCVTTGSAADPACSAFLKIELTPLQPAIAALRLTAFSVNGQPEPNLRFRFRGRNDYLVDTPSFTVAAGFADVPLPPAEIGAEEPLLVEVIQQTPQGTSVVASGQITPADLRRGAANRGAFLVELRKQPSGGALGTVQLVASAPAAP